MIVTVTGDRELWLWRKGNCCFPMYVIPCKGEDGVAYRMILPAIGPNLEQHEAIIEAFTAYSLSGRSDRYVIEASVAETLIERAPGITPLFYFRWEMPTGDIITRTDLEKEPEKFDVPIKKGMRVKGSTESDEFLKFIVQQTKITDLDSLRTIWEMIQLYGAEWLYKSGRSIDLGFCKLDAVPFRANWKQIILSRFPGIGRFFRMGKDKRNAQLQAHEDLPAFLRGTWMIEIDGGENVIGWNIEARSSLAWREYVFENEKIRLKKHGGPAYASWWRSIVYRMENQLYDILGDFIQRTTAPCAGLHSIRGDGGESLVPKVRAGRVLPETEDDQQTLVVYPDPSVNVVDRGKLKEVKFPVAPLPKLLPSLQPEVEDVRDSGRMLTVSIRSRNGE
jgi:hypothetical protein